MPKAVLIMDMPEEFLKGKLQECVDYIRDNCDMERFTEI